MKPLRFLTLLLMCAAAGPLFSQNPGASVKNIITVDINPELTAIFFNVSRVKGFGLGAGYERVLTDHVSLKAGFSTVYLSLYDVNFLTMDFRLSGRFYLLGTAPAGWFVEAAAALLRYSSPYEQGFMGSLGMAAGWKLIIAGHFSLEPYLGLNIYTGDKFLMPFTMTAVSELIMPGFILGMNIGWSF